MTNIFLRVRIVFTEISLCGQFVLTDRFSYNWPFLLMKEISYQIFFCGKKSETSKDLKSVLCTNLQKKQPPKLQCKYSVCVTCVWAMRVKKFQNRRWKIFNQHLLFSIFLDKKFPVKCKYFSHPWRVKVLKKKAFGYWEITARVSYVCAHVKILSPMYYTKLLYISLHVLHIVVHDTRFYIIVK